MSATNRNGHPRHARDLYQTPISALAPLLATGVVDLSGDVWEPCAGGGEIVRALFNHGVGGSILASDIEPGAWPEYVARVGDDGRHDIIDRPPARVRSRRGNRLTVITNAPYRIPHTDDVCGMRGDTLERMVPEAPSNRVDGVRYRWRDGVAAVFAAADRAGADQIVLGPVRSSWFLGAKCRHELRRYILMNFRVRIFSLTERPRFLDADGVPSKGTDSCDYVWVVADRATSSTPWRPYALLVDLGIASDFRARVGGA